MTLLLTHVSHLGVVMAADSAITFYDGNGRIRSVDKKGWQKLFKVPSIQAGLSYWGMIGLIRRRFDEWVEYLIRQQHKYSDLRTFANYISNEMNSAMNGKILEHRTGVHIAGYDNWEDGVARPTFFHIHNGHGEYRTYFEPNQPPRYEWHELEPHKLFTVHQDFPSTERSVSDQEVVLRISGHLTHNGAYYLFSKMFEQELEGIRQINDIAGLTIPSRPGRLSSLKGLWHILLKNSINLYSVSNQQPVVGGTVTTLAFDQERYC